MAAAPPAPPAQAPAPEEVKFPDRDIIIPRLTAIDKSSAAQCVSFVHAFRKSCFHFENSVSRKQVVQLDPPRSAVVAHLRHVAAGYAFPKCLVVNGDLPTEQKEVSGGGTADETRVKFEWKKARLATLGSDDEKEEGEEPGSDDEKAEEDEDDLVGDYGGQYEDRETGEDQDMDEDGSSDND